MTKPEFTNNRDLSYSRWHREKLPSWCYAFDIDFVEVRGTKAVALIETKDVRASELSEWREGILLAMAEKLNIPCFVVWHNLALNEQPIFTVKDLRTGSKTAMNEEEYIKFQETLGK